MDDIFKRIYRSSNFAGMFPFQIKDGKFRLSVLYAILTITLYALMWTIFVYLNYNKLGSIHVRNDIPSFLIRYYALLSDMACVCLSPICFYINIKKMNKILDLFKEVKEITGHSVVVRNYYGISFCLFALARAVYNRVTSMGWGVPSLLLLIFTWAVIGRFFILDQFAMLLYLAKNYLKFLSSRMTRQNAARYVDACERLYLACRFITQCYTPTMLLAITAVFGTITTRGFLVVRRLENEDRIDYIVLIWLLTSFLDLIHCARMATNAIVQAKEFERVLYTLVINDESTFLLTNNKIELHIISEATLEFPLYGLFNLDYSLLLLMISSSTGYIVMLLGLV